MWIFATGLLLGIIIGFLLGVQCAKDDEKKGG